MSVAKVHLEKSINYQQSVNLCFLLFLMRATTQRENCHSLSQIADFIAFCEAHELALPRTISAPATELDK